jgi:cell division transport system permease protein
MKALANTAYFWRSALYGVLRAPLVHLVAVFTIAIVLFAAGLARSSVRLLDSLAEAIGGDVELTVYLRDGADESDAAEVARSLGARAGGSAVVVSPEAALARLRSELGNVGDVLRDLPSNPLPYSVQLRVAPALRTPEALRALAAEARSMPLIQDADYGEQAVSRLSAMSRAARFAGLIAFVAVGLATVFIVAATLQLAIYARRDEIEIQQLVGATHRFVKAPFLVEGAIQGLCGAALALAALWAFSLALVPKLQQLFSFLLRPGAPFSLLSAAVAGELFVAGALLGLSGSFVAVGRLLKR